MIKVKRLNENATIPTRANPTDAGLDLYSDDYYVVYSKEINVIGTSIAIEIPDGYMARIAPRSGLAINHGIDVMAGIIDSSYRGEIKVLLMNNSINNKVFNKGDKIAQLIIQPIELWQPIEVDQLTETNRGVNGFGSTGA